MEISIFFQWLVYLLSNMLPVTSAAFFGAWVAFKLQRSHERKKELAAQVTAGKSAQFAIGIQLNDLKIIKKQYLDSLENDPNRALKLHPFFYHNKFPQLNLESLSFMLEGEGAGLLQELLVSEQTFITLAGTLEMRNARHEKMQARVAAGGAVAIDDATKKILKDLTDSIYDLTTDDAIKNHMEGFDKLKEYLEKRFPKVKGLAVESNY